MIAKLVVHSPKDRTTALTLLHAKLQEYQVVGPSTNIEFLKSLSSHPAFVAGEVETGFIEKHHQQLFPVLPERPSQEALIHASIGSALLEIKSRQRGGPAGKSSNPWNTLHGWRIGGQQVSREYKFSTIPVDSPSAVASSCSVNMEFSGTSDSPSTLDFKIKLPSLESEDDKSLHQAKAYLDASLSASPSASGDTIISIVDGKRYVGLHVSQDDPSGAFSRNHHIFSGDNVASLGIPWPQWIELSKTDGADKGLSGNAVQAVMPSKVIKVMVAPGDRVKAGDGLIVLEAMKTEASGLFKFNGDRNSKQVPMAVADRIFWRKYSGGHEGLEGRDSFGRQSAGGRDGQAGRNPGAPISGSLTFLSFCKALCKVLCTTNVALLQVPCEQIRRASYHTMNIYRNGSHSLVPEPVVNSGLPYNQSELVYRLV
jgi:3-methylcrotonyl-CoA carboxylase alpha subunit